MRHFRRFSLGVSLAVAMLVGCDRDETAADGPEPTVGQRIADAGEKVGDTLDTAAQRTGEAVGRAVDELPERTERAAEAVREGARELAADVSGDVHNILAEATEAALSPGGIDDVVQRFAEHDRARIGDVDASAFAELETQVRQFRQRWQDKFGREFDIKDGQEVMSFVTIRGDPAGGDRSVAVFPARAGMPELRVPMVREAGAWRIDVPDSLTAQQLAGNLLSGIAPITAGNPPLPEDETEAYRSTVHGAMAAIMGERRTP